MQQSNSRSSFLIITGTSPESYSPAGERIRHLALASESKFDKVTILGLYRSKKCDESRKDSRVSLYTISFSRGAPYPLSVLFDPVKTLVLLAHGLALSRSVKPSYVLASMPPFEAGVSAWILAQLRRIPLLIDLRDDWESAADALLKRYFSTVSVALLSLIARKVYSTAHTIFAVTGTIADTVKKRGVSTKVLLVPNGADTDFFIPLSRNGRKKMREEFNLPLDKTIVVYCGSGINPYYRLNLTLSVIKALTDEEKTKIFFVYYVYNGADRLKSLQRTLGIPEGQLEIREPLPRSQLAKVLAACDVGLVPFDSAPYLLCARSTKIYEYLSSGLYVICSGPRGGELDALFSSQSELGKFVLPSVENFAEAFKFVEENNKNALSEDSRSLRHSFIRENYDRQNIMKTAMNALFTDVHMKGD